MQKNNNNNLICDHHSKNAQQQSQPSPPQQEQQQGAQQQAPTPSGLHLSGLNAIEPTKLGELNIPPNVIITSAAPCKVETDVQATPGAAVTSPTKPCVSATLSQDAPTPEQRHHMQEIMALTKKIQEHISCLPGMSEEATTAASRAAAEEATAVSSAEQAVQNELERMPAATLAAVYDSLRSSFPVSSDSDAMAANSGGPEDLLSSGLDICPPVTSSPSQNCVDFGQRYQQQVAVTASGTSSVTYQTTNADARLGVLANECSLGGGKFIILSQNGVDYVSQHPGLHGEPQQCHQQGQMKDGGGGNGGFLSQAGDVGVQMLNGAVFLERHQQTAVVGVS